MRPAKGVRTIFPMLRRIYPMLSISTKAPCLNLKWNGHLLPHRQAQAKANVLANVIVAYGYVNGETTATIRDKFPPADAKQRIQLLPKRMPTVPASPPGNKCAPGNRPAGTWPWPVAVPARPR